MVSKLYAITQKKERCIIGLMSGTSLDGLDIALCRISGQGRTTKVVVDEFATIVYPQPLVQKIRMISQEQVSLAGLCSMNIELGEFYAGRVNSCLKKWKVDAADVDLVSSHGQTIYHLPRPSAPLFTSTLQIADADVIARKTGIITVSDFRIKHIAAGGEGAPLAGYGDFLVFSGTERDVVMLNIGGISNLTLLPKQNGMKILCTDVAPGNTLIDSWMRARYSAPFDINGSIAARGNVNNGLFRELNNHPFLKLPFPKTSGPEEFNYHFIETCIKAARVENISNEDVAATLTRFTVLAIADAIRLLMNDAQFDLYISGGGLHNKTVTTQLAQLLPQANFLSTEDAGIHPDAKEAVLFAILANECIAGSPETFIGTGLQPVRMGKISFPD